MTEQPRADNGPFSLGSPLTDTLLAGTSSRPQICSIRGKGRPAANRNMSNVRLSCGRRRKWGAPRPTQRAGAVSCSRTLGGSFFMIAPIRYHANGGVPMEFRSSSDDTMAVMLDLVSSVCALGTDVFHLNYAVCYRLRGGKRTG